MVKNEIIKYLNLLNDKLNAEHIFGDLYMYGGAVMCAVFNSRESTKDIDALFEPKTKISFFAKQIAEEHHLPVDWLNDGVKGFISYANDSNMVPFLELSNLRIMTPSPEYLFAMKCMACRIGEDSSDLQDLKFLADYLGISNQQDAENILLQFFPMQFINVKISYVLANLFEDQDENT